MSSYAFQVCNISGSKWIWGTATPNILGTSFSGLESFPHTLMGQYSMQGCRLQISRALCVALCHPVVFLGLPALSQLRDTDELRLGSPSLCNGLETFLQEYVGGNERIYIICLLSLRGHYPPLFELQCLENHCFIYFDHFPPKRFLVKWKSLYYHS